MIQYISTRGGGPQNFEQVMLQGLAPDGGLYVPHRWPKVDIKALREKSYVEIAEAVMFPFIEGNIDKKDFRAVLEKTYSKEVFRHPEVFPLVKIAGRIHVLELFHGPTLAFKDVALQLLGRLFDHVLAKRNEHITIIGATSGDTGSAAIEGCCHSKHVDIFIFFPEGRVSEVQRRQMTTVTASNVHCIGVQGTFDDCQSLVKAMFADEDFRKKINMSAVNSINWARIMAQIVYYFYAALKLDAPEERVSFVAPTGNFGNVYAAYAARQMGLPVETLSIATNKNDILTRFFESGEMRLESVEPTISPSMDIQVSSNFERYLFDLLNHDAEKLKKYMQQFKTAGSFSLPDEIMQKARKDFSAYRCDEEKTLGVMKQAHDKYNYILEPHSAVGFAAAQEVERLAGGSVVALATAHPAKFPDAVQKSTGSRPPLPAPLTDLLQKEERYKMLPADLKAVQHYILSTVKP